MADVRPFAGIRYDPSRRGGDLSSVICPPYDVLDEAGRAALIARDEKNFVTVDLPHVPPKQAGPQEVYDRSAATLNGWLADGTLLRDPAPCLYVYHQAYEFEGRSYLRKMFFARLKLEEFGQGSVFPHEQTFGGPKEDRLKLTTATRCNLSPIFGMYPDADNAVSAAFAESVTGPPTCSATLDGIENRLWAVSDGKIIETIARLMADKNVYIADGHHRYGTALMYREQVRKEFGDLPANHPANFVLTVFCSMEDPGCLILPTHRVLTGLDGLDAAGLADLWDQGCATCSPDTADLVLYDGTDEVAVRFTNRKILDTLAPEQSPAWRALDLAYFHRVLVEELAQQRAGLTPKIAYIKAEADARNLARRGAIACLTKPIPMQALRAVSEAGDLMPQKSTFFYPKLATGLVVHPLTTET